MSDIKKSKRKESSLQVIHNAYEIRRAVTNLAENNFYITLSKVEDKINKRIQGLTEEDKKRVREQMYKFYRNQINRVANNAIELATGISRHLRIANTIYPCYMSEFEERMVFVLISLPYDYLYGLASILSGMGKGKEKLSLQLVKVDK